MNKFLLSLLVVFASACAVNKSTKSMHPYSGGAIGCGNFIIYKLTEDKTAYVSVIFDVGSVELTQRQAYAVGKADVVQLKRKEFAGPIDASLCNDVMAERPEEVLEEIALEGIVEIHINDLEIERAEKNEAYNVTIVLKKIVFKGVTIDYLRINGVTVGWLPG